MHYYLEIVYFDLLFVFYGLDVIYYYLELVFYDLEIVLNVMIMIFCYLDMIFYVYLLYDILWFKKWYFIFLTVMYYVFKMIWWIGYVFLSMVSFLFVSARLDKYVQLLDWCFWANCVVLFDDIVDCINFWLTTTVHVYIFFHLC